MNDVKVMIENLFCEARNHECLLSEVIHLF